MKRQILAITGAIAALAGCTSTLEPAAKPEGEGIFATIEQPELPLQTKSLNWENDALKFTWGSSEDVIVFGREGNKGKADAALLRTLTSGAASSKLESKGFQLMDGINYYAFIPANNFNITTDFTFIPLTFEGQRQTANNSTSHMKAFDYACATATKEDGLNSLEFNLKNQVAWIVVEHLFTEETKGVTSIALSTEDALFTTTCYLDVTTSTLKSNKYSPTLTMNLGTANGSGLDFAKGEYMRAFFTTAPVDLTGKELTITAKKADGTSVELLKKTSDASCNIEKNTTVVIRTSDATPAATVATLDGREFSDLEDAIAAAEKAGKQSTITLADNVTGSFTIANPMPLGKEIILDLNGHSITAEGDSETAILIKQGDVRLKNGNIESKKFVGVKFDPQAKGARVYLVDCTVNSNQGAVCTSTATGCQIIIYGGSFTATNNAVIAGNGSLKYAGTQEARDKGNTITISDNKGNVPVFNGSVVDADAVACGLYSPWKDVITIEAAKFNIENGVGILCRGGQITVNDAEISVTGGDRTGLVADGKLKVPCKTFYKDDNCGYPDIENADIDIKGGKYSDDSGSQYAANGYSYTSTGETPLAYKVVENETKLLDAISAVSEGGDVTIDYYASLKNQLRVQKNFNLILSDNAVITGDATNGRSLMLYCQDKGNNTISGKGTIISPDDKEGAIIINGKEQTLTINSKDVTVKGGSASKQAPAITLWDGKLVINDGHFISGSDKSGNNSPAIYLTPQDDNDAVELEINGGVFESVSGNAQYLINCYDDDIARCIITIKGGTFIGFNPAASNADKINGQPANWVAKGYVSVEDSNNPGTWIVKPESVNP